MAENKNVLFKIVVVALAACIIALFAVYLLRRLGFTNIEVLRAYVSKGMWGMVVYIFLQIFQVIFIPVSTSMFTIPAIVLFGQVKGFFVCWIGCTCGSILLFIIVRSMREKALKWIAGSENATRITLLLGKGKYLLPVLFLIPIFPDDILCSSAGLSDIKLPYFAAVITVTRGIDAAFTAFVGAALIKSTAGIVVICLFVLSMLALSIYLTKNREKTEQWVTGKLLKIFSKFKRPNKRAAR